MPSSYTSARKPMDLNPAFLYSPSPTIFLHYDINPLLGFPLNMAFAPITKESAFYTEHKNTSSTKHLVDCVKGLFAQWATAFRKALANKSVIRIFCGDALDLCLTLRNHQLSSHLHHSDVENTIPLNFDIIDTSNLLEPLGMNVIVAASMALKYNAHSSLYTEWLSLFDSSCPKRLFGIFGVDASSMALLLGLVSPVLFTNAKNSIEQSTVGHGLQAWLGAPTEGMDFSYSRLRWIRSPGYQTLSIQVEPKALADLLVQVHNDLFRHEDLALMSNMPSVLPGEQLKLCMPRYNRASFALLLSCLQATVVTDWDECFEFMYDSILSTASPGSLRFEYMQDLFLNLHLYGVDSGRVCKPTSAAVSAAILAPRMPPIDNMPVQLCVTVRVSREQFDFSVKKNLIIMDLVPAYLCCNFQGGDPGDDPWSHTFSTLRLAFGTWHAKSKGSKPCPYIKEDYSQMWGTSDLFVSVMVPTEMLLRSKLSIPWASIRVIQTPQSCVLFRNIGKDLCLARSQMTSKDVFITLYMPGMSTLPGFPLASPRQDKPTPAAVTARLTHDGLKIDSLVRRITLESQEAKNELANTSSTVEVEYKSPLTASVLIARAHELEFQFPAPVSPSKYKMRIARKSAYIEIETPLFDPLKENAASFIFPTFIAKTSYGATIPKPWASTYIDFDIMPPLDLKETNAISWLVEHGSVMFSERERRIHKASMTNSSLSETQVDIRTNLKEGLFSIFMHYAGLRGQQAEFFGLTTTKGGIETLIFPSCLRLDLINHTVVLDAAMILMTNAMSSDPRAVQFLQELTNYGLCQVKVSKGENLAWKAMMPALVERCRSAATWKHTSDCEYVKEGEVPLRKGLSAEGVSPICSCGIGKFPPGGYLKCQTGRLPDLNYMISRYATRIALAPIFAVMEIEDCLFPDFVEKLGFSWYSWDSKAISPKIKRYITNLGMYNRDKCVIQEKCAKCGKQKRESTESSELKLSHCSKCKIVRYCSRECQIADWQKHKPLCSAT